MSVWKKIARVIKNPIFASKSFNLLKYSQPQGIIEQDEADRWLAEQETQPQPQTQTQTQPQPQPQTQTQQLVKAPQEPNLHQIIDRYIKENIGQENLDILPNKEILNSLKNSPSDIEYFIDKVIEFSGGRIERIYAENFVNAVMGHSEKYFQSEEFERVQEEAPVYEQGLHDISEEKQNLDTYFEIAIKATGNLGPKGKEVLKSSKDADEIINNGIKRALGDPESDRTVDQRINFFLNNPEVMQDLIPQELIDKTEGKTVSQKIKLLKENAGPRLFNRLKQLIKDKDKSIISWVDKHFRYDIKDQSLDVPLGEEGTAMGDLVPEQKVLSEQKREVLTPKQKEARNKVASRQIAVFCREYLKDIINEVKLLKEKTSGQILESYYNKVINGIDPVKNNKIYTKIEKMDMFAQSSLDNMDSLLSTTGKVSLDKGRYLYYTPYGKLAIPTDIIDNIFKERIAGSNELSDEDMKNYVEIYKNKIEDGLVEKWFPKWTSLTTPKSIVENYNEVGKLKKRIKQLYKKGVTDVASIYNYLSAEKKSDVALKKFAGGNIKRFIEMTIAQRDEDAKSYLVGKTEDDRHNLKVKFNEDIAHLFKPISEVKNKESLNPESVNAFISLFYPSVDVRKLPSYWEAIGKEMPDDVREHIAARSFRKSHGSKVGNEFMKLSKGKMTAKNELATKEKIIAKAKEKLEWTINKYNGQVEKRLGLSPEEKKRRGYPLDPMALVDQDWGTKLDMADYVLWGVVKAGKTIPTLEAKIKGLEEKTNKLKSKIAAYELEIENMKKKYDINIAGKEQFRILYSAWKDTLNKVFKLTEMKNRYDSIKFASGSSCVEDMINQTLNQYETFFFNIIR